MQAAAWQRLAMVDARRPSRPAAAVLNSAMGNVGHPGKKLNFSVFGDTVNFWARIEGMTKTLGQDILISESVQRRIKDVIPCRLVDSVPIGARGSAKVFGIGPR